MVKEPCGVGEGGEDALEFVFLSRDELEKGRNGVGGGGVGAALSVVHDVTAMSGVVTDAAAVEVSIAVPC